MYHIIMRALGLCTVVIFLGGCMIVDAPAKGVIFTLVNGPITATSVVKAPRTGESCAYSILGWVAWGDASIHGAKGAGGVAEVSSVDHETLNVLGVFGYYCTVVRGS
jgi:hypothetical protein